MAELKFFKEVILKEEINKINEKLEGQIHQLCQDKSLLKEEISKLKKKQNRAIADSCEEIEQYSRRLYMRIDLVPSVAYLALSERGCEIFGKRHNNKMIKFLLIVYFHGTKNYQSIFLFLNSVSNIYYTILYYTILYYTISFLLVFSPLYYTVYNGENTSKNDITIPN